MAGQSLVVVALVVVLAALVNGNCKPTFDPKLDCSKEAGEGWEFFGGMGYKYFPKALTKEGANTACKPWDEAICNTNSWQSFLASYLTDGELEGGIRKAYNAACIKNGHIFWSGVERSTKGSRLFYNDFAESDSSKHAFSGGIPYLKKGTDCVAFDVSGDKVRMVVKPCNEDYPYMCKIMPVRH